MTLKELLEIVQLHHPQQGETMIRQGLNRAQDSFSAKTGILKATANDTTVVAQRAYPLHDEMLELYRVELDTEMIPKLIGGALSIPVGDVDDEAGVGSSATPITAKAKADKYAWYLDNKILNIVEKCSATADYLYEWQSVSTAGITIKVYYTRKAAKYSSGDLTLVSELPSQFHEALAFKVLSEFYKLPGDTFKLQVASYFDQEFEKEVREGKKYAKRGHQRSGYIQPWSF